MFLKSYNSPLDKFVSKPLGTPVGDKIRYFTILEKRILLALSVYVPIQLQFNYSKAYEVIVEDTPLWCEEILVYMYYLNRFCK